MQDLTVEGFQLSPQQRRLWRLTRESSGDSPFVAECVVRIRGDVDRVVLASVVDDLAARHEILRTSFHSPEGMSAPFQVIGVASGPAAARIDLESVVPGEHRLTIQMPAMLCDVRGLANLVADIAATYAARVRGTVVETEPLQYVDAATWLNETLDSPETAAGRRFWEARDLQAALRARLPFERPNAEDAPFTPRQLAIELPSGSLPASPDMFLFACWRAFLQRIIGDNDVIVGYVVDGRAYPELETAVGLFARCLPLASNASIDLSIVEATARLGADVREATQWGECFDWRLTAHDRSTRTPFVPIAFERQEWNARFEADAVVFDIVALRAVIDRFAVKLCCRSTSDTLTKAWIEYDASTCDVVDVERLAAQFEVFVKQAASHPTTPLAELDLLPVVQQQDILTFSRAAPGEQAENAALVHHAFERAAARDPRAVAVVCDDVAISYEELNRRSNQLAHYLQTLGVGADVLVGLCVERSVDVAVGILGILKAGGAYVPLDPQLPPQRLAIMLTECGATIVVSHSAARGRLNTSARTVLLDEHRSILDAFPATNPVKGAQPRALAYALFTSGSTGKPKAVAVEHRQLACYVRAIARQLDVPPGAAFATVTTFAADLGNTAIFPALASGGRLHIVTEARAADPAAFADYAERHRIDVLKIVPSHLKALLSSPRGASVLPRQRLVLGGESCSWDLVDQVRQLAPACRVFNHYGPTETTVGATMHEADAGLRSTVTVPIGRPLDHARVYVLDDRRRMVPVWTPGELYIGGDGVARGYLGDPQLTSEKFVPDRWSNDTDARMYRTGDRVRMLPGGALEFLGRIDEQIKIRGFRVEPGEVNAALRRHAAISTSAVLAHDDGSGTRLAAFVVYHPGNRPPVSELRTFLRDQGLPDYMMPASVVPLDRLPLTKNGKLDRERLFEALEANPENREAADEPLNDWESMVARVWQEFLGVDQIQPCDNFYDLGGHSLMAIQVVSALERTAQVQISPRDLVFHTLRQFAALCASKSAPSGDGRGLRASSATT